MYFYFCGLDLDILIIGNSFVLRFLGIILIIG